MVDMTALAEIHASPASAIRLKARHRAEIRMKAYGIGAITLAGVALVALLWSVIGQAAGALSESYVTLPVTIDAGSGGATLDAEAAGAINFDGLTKDMMRAVFPQVSSRAEKRELNDVLSGGAGFELRAHVMADPGLVGQTLEFAFLASDITDLYLKGKFGRLRAQDHNGTLTVTVAGDDIDITSNAPDFAVALGALKEALLEQAAFQRNQAMLQDRGVRAFTQDAATAASSDERDRLLAEAASRQSERDRLIALAQDFEARAAALNGSETLDNTAPSILLSLAGGWVKLTEISSAGGRGKILSPLSAEGVIPARDWQFFIHDVPERSRKISDAQIVWIETLRAQGAIDRVFNWRFFTSGDSREPELAGILGAAVGSFWTMLVTFVIAFPMGVMAAIYLEEFAPRNRFTDFIEVNINNLAAVPSIVFGLLGLAVFIGFFGVPRSAPLAGGLVLAVMTLPTIIIASRTSIAAVPPSIRDAALGLGASQLQTSFHHVFPLALPGILTGTIIGMARALGETAPLIMIGMVAFIVDVPKGILGSATVLPVQIYRWADFPEQAFEARTAAAICTLLVFLILMNALAVFLRKRFERRW